MFLVSGLQASGKTSTTLKVCRDEDVTGFLLDLRVYKGNKNDQKEMTAFVIESIMANPFAEKSLPRHVMGLFFPKPAADSVWIGLRAAFKQGNMVIVVDEVQKLANEYMTHDGIFNELCIMSPHGPVILLGSEYSIPQYMLTMSHVAKRTKVLYAPTATTEEMLPHVQARFKEHAPKIVEQLDGSFELLGRLVPEAMPDHLEKLFEWHKERLIYALELTDDGMKSARKAASTGEAMVATAKLAFGSAPIRPFNKGTLELAQAGGAKIETLDLGEKASFATPMTERAMKDLVCSEAVLAIMQKRVPPELFKEFVEAIEGKCTKAVPMV